MKPNEISEGSMKSLTRRPAGAMHYQYGYVRPKNRPKALACMAVSAIISVSLITLLIALLI